MLAVIEMGGNQFIVRKGDIIDVKKQNVQDGETITVKALLVSNEDGTSLQVGTPVVEKSAVELKAVSTFKGEKVRVFKMKSKKRYQRNKGFRPELTQFEVMSIA